MKPGLTADQLAFLANSNSFFIAELYTFKLLNGTSWYFTGADVKVTANGTGYVASALLISGLGYKVGIGFTVDEQEMRVAANPQDTSLDGVEFLAGISNGLLDGAYVTRQRAFWASPADVGSEPVVVVPIFIGRVSTITKVGRTAAQIKLKSPLVLLNIDMPRNFYTPGCQHTLYDSECTLVKSTFGYAGTVDIGPSALSIPWAGGVQPGPTGADGLGNYAQGRLLFTTGALNGLQFLIADNDISTLHMAYSFNTLPAQGDRFTAFFGCSKTINSCFNKFANLQNFRGFPFIPPVFTSV